ncbi:type VI secretion system Vgr family protein [Burkholderia ubonensis]|uniref:type VI secretion system Vgr family protein n=1 Tax=Burkholderia ubonensis TaxID=101571 RepID=UPI000A3FF10B|nr:type VI secretion system Vgr family protein [Burkholderia ubonensis]
MFDSPRTLSVSGATMPKYGDQIILAPVRLSGGEVIGELFEYMLELKTPDEFALSPSIAANVDLDKLIGTEVTVSIEIEGKGHSSSSQVGAGTREITGVVSDATIVREDGRSIVYALTLRPWLWLATKNQDCRIFQDMSVVEITDAVLSSYPFPVEKRLVTPKPNDAWPKRDIQRQHFESDWEFLQRLWEEWGIFYFFEHSGGNHRLVLCNSIGLLQSHGEAYQTIRYQAQAGQRTGEEYIHALSVRHSLTTGGVTSVDYDYTRPRANLTVKREDSRDTGAAHQEHYTWGDHAQPQAGAAGLSGESNEPRSEAEYLTIVQMQAHRCQGLRASGKGNLRGLVAGQTFALTHYPQKTANREYAVIGFRLEIEDIGESSGTGQRFSFETDFTVQPTSEPFRLSRTIDKPRIGGSEYAVISCPDNQEIWTDAYGRVKVQFLWDRLGKNDERSSCWVRVAGAWHGDQFGGIFLPRRGQEVEVIFVNGDPDLPVIIGSAATAFTMPPFELPKNQALAGYRSCEIGGRRANTLAFDDTSGKIQTHLSSDEGSSQLNLGYITRIAGNEGRKEERGRGFELLTDLWGMVRAMRGLVVTTDTAQGRVKDVDAAAQRLTQAHQQHKDLADLAQNHQAQDTQAGQNDAAQGVKTQNDAIQGEATSQENPFPELTRADLMLSSAAGVVVTAADSTHLASIRDHALTAGRDVSVSAGRSLLASVQGAISFFAAQFGVRLFAAKGKVQVQAQSDEMALAALKDLTITSTDGKLILNAAKEIWIGAGGSYVRISGQGIENGTSGQIVEKCVTWSKQPGASMNQPLPELPTGEMTSACVTFADHAAGGPAADIPYRLDAGDGRALEGISDAKGRSAELSIPTGRDVQVSTPPRQHDDTYHVPSRDVLDNPV